MEERIVSRKNPLLQQVRRLLNSKKERHKTAAGGCPMVGWSGNSNFK